MVIAVTASNNTGIDSKVDLRFGRASYFAVVDSNTMEVNFINNPANSAASGAGVTAAQTIADQGVTILISGNFGPKAFTALQAAGVKLYSFSGGTVKEAVGEFKAGLLKELTTPTNNAHTGLK